MGQPRDPDGRYTAEGGDVNPPRTPGAQTPQNQYAARDRQYETIVVVGPSGYGKSSFTDEIRANYRKQNPSWGIWIIDPVGNWPRHIYNNPRGEGFAFWPGVGKQLDIELAKLKTSGPGLIIGDDADFYMRHPTDARLEIIIGNRHWQKDMIWVARRPQGLPKDLFQVATALAIFHQQQQYAREYIATELEEPRISREIPREKFKYLYVHRESGGRKVYATQKRATVTISDIQR
jgi:hypothetical protein